MIQVGQRVRFDAFGHMRFSTERTVHMTTGTVVWINKPHKWFLVEHDGNNRASFKFSQIGNDVFLSK